MCNAEKGSHPARAQGKHGYLVLDLYHRLWPDTLFICGRLHLIELHPGKDPDTLQGLRDLNAHGNNIQILRLAEFAAPNTEATHFQDGRVRPAPHPCCHDQWPNGNPIEVPGPCADPICQ
jgi:hypothetical protein